MDHDSTYEQVLFDAGIDELFEALFAKQQAGEISLKDVGDFFPEEVKARY